MVIKGRERGLEFNVQSHEEISKLCPDNDMAKMGDLYKSTFDSVNNTIKIAIALNRGYEDHRAYDNPSYKPEYLTEEDFRFFSMTDIHKLGEEVTACMKEGEKTEIELEPVKQSSKNAKRAGVLASA